MFGYVSKLSVCEGHQKQTPWKALASAAQNHQVKEPPEFPKWAMQTGEVLSLYDTAWLPYQCLKGHRPKQHYACLRVNRFLVNSVSVDVAMVPWCNNAKNCEEASPHKLRVIDVSDVELHQAAISKRLHMFPQFGWKILPACSLANAAAFGAVVLDRDAKQNSGHMVGKNF